MFQKHNIEGIRFKGVFTTAEKLFDYQRQFIAEQFNCNVYDGYGCGEIQSIAFECEKGKNLHISEEHVILELTNREKSIKEGSGQVVLTNLDNYGMPFIRYQNGDVATYANEKCSCGRSLKLLSKIDGRTHDFITASDGSLIAGEFFPHLFGETRGIKQYQIVQLKRDELIFKIVRGNKYSQKYIGKNVHIIIEFVDDIIATPSGKRHFTISKIPVKI